MSNNTYLCTMPNFITSHTCEYSHIHAYAMSPYSHVDKATSMGKPFKHGKFTAQLIHHV